MDRFIKINILLCRSIATENAFDDSNALALFVATCKYNVLLVAKHGSIWRLNVEASDERTVP